VTVPKLLVKTVFSVTLFPPFKALMSGSILSTSSCKIINARRTSRFDEKARPVATVPVAVDPGEAALLPTRGVIAGAAPPRTVELGTTTLVGPPAIPEISCPRLVPRFAVAELL